MSAIIQLIDYFSEMHLHFPEVVSGEALQDQIPTTSLVMLDPYRDDGSQSRAIDE